MYARKRKIEVLFIFTALLLFSSVGCEKIEKLQLAAKKNSFQPKGTVIAKVDNLPITSEQLDQEIQNYNQLMENPAAKITTREQKIAYLNEELIRRYLFYLDAKSRGMQEN